MSFLAVYCLSGLFLYLYEVLKGTREGVSFLEQMRTDLFLAGDDTLALTFSILLYIISWPILLVIYSGGPPTRGA